MKNCLLCFVLLLSLLALSFCSGQPTKKVTVSWVSNRETLVNTIGGGYKVYYSTQSNSAISSATPVDVPYISGASAPTSAVLDLPSGEDYYIRIVAYSTLNGATFTSIPSAEQVISLK